jgi:hypothetical protein
MTVLMCSMRTTYTTAITTAKRAEEARLIVLDKMVQLASISISFRSDIIGLFETTQSRE